MSAIPLPLVLRKEDCVVVAAYDEKAATLKELADTQFSGDFRECEVCFSRADPSVFAYASTKHLRCCQCVCTAAAGGGGGSSAFDVNILFETEMPHVVVDMRFSPRGTYLVTYAMMDTKRTPEGNLSVFEVSTGRLLRRGMQARWPAMEWTADEAFVARPVQGWLHVLDGNFDRQTERATAGETAEELAGSNGDSPAMVTSSGAALSKMDLMLAHDKEIEYAASPAEGFPVLALFKPFYKNRQGTFSLYRLPNVQESPMYTLSFGRAESGSISWSRHSGKHLALLIASQRDPSGKSYYGTVTLHLIDVLARKVFDVKLKGEGETVHDCQWCPNSDELMVVHGRMPHNKATLYSRTGVPLMTFGEAPRNLIQWAPNGAAFVLGGSGNLAGDLQFYDHTPSAAERGDGSAALPAQAAAATRPAPKCTGELNDKCSFQTWAPDSHNFLCATVFTRLRMDNKLRFVRNNGATVLLQRYDVLYGAHWIALKPPDAYPLRLASPRAAGEEEKPKPQVYRPPGGTSRAAAMLRRPDGAAGAAAKPALPVGAGVVVQKKKKKR